MNTFQPYQQALTLCLALVAVLMPLLAFFVNVCLPRKTNKAAGWVSTFAILSSLVCAIIVFINLWNQPQLHWQVKWFTIGTTNLYAGLWLNNHSVIMLLLVPAIALPVHIYSTAYMKYDERYKRYFTYLSLFCFSMLALVVADSMILFYVFWELVGFSSYLLIGFWFTKEKAVLANKKAFIMNRIGDVGLLIALLIIFVQSGSFDLNQLFGSYGLIAQAQTENGLWIGASTTLPVFWQYVACGGIFLAVAAKTAQFPLHTWLPDAMEGPTSVSALIHAATMVAAGVFLLGRLYPLFTPTELDILAAIGCFTAFMAATIALTQNDLKRILAYSTISQLGFMVMAMGIGAYASSLFHLITHAFFKCLLFLVAGIVIHEMAHIKDDNKLDIDPQNILNMGGLRKKLPFTFMTALIGAAALIGLPLTSGYLSKDGILIQSFDWAEQRGFWYMLLPVGAILTTGLTAFYVSRLIVKVFFGEFKLEKVHPNLHFHISDGSWQYKAPLLFLAACSLFPIFSLNPVSYENAWVFRGFSVETALDRANIYHTIVPLGVNIVSVFVIYFAYAVYVKRNSWSAPQHSFLFKLSYNQWYIDAFYNKIIVGGVLAASRALSWFDRNIIDGFVHLLSNTAIALSKVAAWFDYYVIDGVSRLATFIVQVIGNFIRYFQSGKIQYYLFSMVAIVLLLFIYLIVKI
ncbi:NADH-quinone oxidoreductase subunit 5 family protein [Mucilaginibacter auburnensis]|uniref:NADH-quinone oxidoreductase subunit L n=1 Tax=Mucilaginibacter auburnensis TaxID=1457233 RepID=A0A2H9VUJ6_9SPHI|nr:NADH-quinone oxidoreductase subunit L [Mucilaginibacter auburnensis]PJJ84478.1 NADH-quinone oxidoreductase subunit L [Mucilaginibacter auburnensis]